MRPHDIFAIRTPSCPTIHPDGSRVIYPVTWIDADADAYRSRLWVVPVDGSAPPRRFTAGVRDTRPSFSPDGRWVAFLRATDEDPAQLHVAPADGGEPRAVTDAPLGVLEYAWSPDSARIAYVARVPEEGRYGTNPDLGPSKEPPRRITTLKYRVDGLGFTVDRRPHVFVVDPFADGIETRQLTDGDADDRGVAWRPDGSEIAFVSARHATRDTDLATDVFAVPVDGGEPRRITDTSLPIQSRVGWSPDGSRVLFTAAGGLDAVGHTLGVFSAPADGGSPQRLTDLDFDVGVDDPDDCPVLVDDEAVVTAVLHEGAVHLVRFPIHGGAPETLIEGTRRVTGYTRAADRYAVTVADHTSAGELVVLDATGTKTLTDEGRQLATTTDLRPMEELRAVAADDYEVHGWVVKPAGDGPFPVVQCIHGGPHAQHGYELFDEAQVYAGAGYAVVLGNPRGSAGYGEAHGRAIVGRFGDVDHADLTALLDAALTDPALDADRVAVMGGSYGGYMTVWSAAHSDRFSAAVVERALTAPDSFLGSSDIGSFFTDAYFGANSADRERQSPLAHAATITAPTLIIHSEEDWRCPIEQAQRLFVELRRNGTPAEFLVFPGEGHELSRSGLPSHRIARFEAILDWLGRHLG